MDKEREIIKRMISILPQSAMHSNAFFESDAEIINFNNKQLLFSIDEFSREDFFPDDDAYLLGCNLCIATVSDILATGGKPIMYGHSVSVQNNWDQHYLDLFSKGIANVLDKCSAGFIGGDLGYSNNWHYTGIALGKTEKALSRKGACVGNLIYMTGDVGVGNIQAGLKLLDSQNLPELKNHHFELSLRIKESNLVNEYATSCIDSSDGILSALNTIAEINNTGYQIEDLPYKKEGWILCKELNLPVEILLMGECGEYELVFTIKKEHEKAFCENATKHGLTFTKIGEVKTKQLKELKKENGITDLNGFNLKARNYDNIETYLRELIDYAKSIK